MTIPDEIPLREIPERLRCLGYWGLGSGWAVARRLVARSDGSAFCTRCPHSQACWTLHRDRVQRLLPEASRRFEALAASVGGPAAATTWVREFKAPDPFTALVMANLQDGAHVSVGWKPKDRGPATIPWPIPEARA